MEVWLVLAVVTWDYLAIEEDINSLRYERARIGLDHPQRVLSKPLLLTQLGAYTRFARTAEHAAMSAPELAAMATVVQRFPSGPNLVRYAAALAMNDRPALASEALRDVCKMSRAAGCDEMKRLWRALGETRPALAKVPWPSD